MRRAFTIALTVRARGRRGAGVRADQRRQDADIYYIDTEGGQSTLFVSPTGESLLVDTGNAGDRDLGRIVDALKAAGVKQIDHMWTTHYHGDHVGAMVAAGQAGSDQAFLRSRQAASPNDRASSRPRSSPMYEELSEGKRTIVKPGDKVQMAGLDITTVRRNQCIKTNLPGGGKPNAACAGVQKKDESAYFDPDNGRVGRLRDRPYGKFRTVDLGDLTWNGELDI